MTWWNWEANPGKTIRQPPGITPTLPTTERLVTTVFNRVFYAGLPLHHSPSCKPLPNICIGQHMSTSNCLFRWPDVGLPLPLPNQKLIGTFNGMPWKFHAGWSAAVIAPAPGWWCSGDRNGRADVPRLIDFQSSTKYTIGMENWNK